MAQYNVPDAIRLLLKNIDEGRQFIRSQSAVFADFDEAVRLRDRAVLESDAESFDQWNEEVNRLYLVRRQATAFLSDFTRGLAILLDRLPLRPEWELYRNALKELHVGYWKAWTDPPGIPDLVTLKLRLDAMLLLSQNIR